MDKTQTTGYKIYRRREGDVLLYSYFSKDYGLAKQHFDDIIGERDSTEVWIAEVKERTILRYKKGE